MRSHTRPEYNERIDAELAKRLRFYAAQDEEKISQRLEELDREWNIERILESNAAALLLLSLLFRVTRGRKCFCCHWRFQVV